VSGKVYGYRMAHEEADQLDIWFMLRSAIDRRCPVRIMFFKQKKDAQHRPEVDRYGNPVFARVTRVVEPYELGRTKAGKPIVRVVDRTPEGIDSRPEYRVIRLDRIAVRFADQRPVITRMLTHGFMCPTPLDGDELHPTKGELAGRKAGVLLSL
jgi:hypothetical protein